MWPPQKLRDLIVRVLDRPVLNILLRKLKDIDQHRQAAAYWFYVYRPRRGDVIIDVGAGNGLQTIWMSKKISPGGRMYALEAHPATFAELESRCRRSKFNNIVCLNLAVADKSGECFIDDNVHHESNSIRPIEELQSEQIKVKAVTLDELTDLYRIESVDLIKMNIEGAERLAILGMEETLKRTRFICIACHDFKRDPTGFMTTKDLVIEFLQKSGYEVVTRNEHPFSWVKDHVHGINTRLQG